MNTLAQTLVVSAPDTFISLVIAQAMPRTITCITPRWYSTLINAAKKITVGSTWNANTKPSLLASVSDPNTSDEPCMVKLDSTTKPCASALKIAAPQEVSNTNIANRICSTTPVATSFQSTAFLLLENSQAIASSTLKPNKPNRISMCCCDSRTTARQGRAGGGVGQVRPSAS